MDFYTRSQQLLHGDSPQALHERLRTLEEAFEEAQTADELHRVLEGLEGLEESFLMLNESMVLEGPRWDRFKDRVTNLKNNVVGALRSVGSAIAAPFRRAGSLLMRAIRSVDAARVRQNVYLVDPSRPGNPLPVSSPEGQKWVSLANRLGRNRRFERLAGAGSFDRAEAAVTAGSLNCGLLRPDEMRGVLAGVILAWRPHGEDGLAFFTVLLRATTIEINIEGRKPTKSEISFAHLTPLQTTIPPDQADHAIMYVDDFGASHPESRRLSYEQLEPMLLRLQLLINNASE